MTPTVAQVALEEAAQRPYEQAVRHLSGTHGMHLGKELLENLTQTIGRWWLQEDDALYQRSRQQLGPLPSEVIAHRCLVFADGAMVHTQGQWHEVRVGTVRSELPDASTLKSGIARRTDVEAFGQDLLRHACRMGYGGASVEGLNPRSSAALQQAKHELVTYLTNNRERMDDPRYESLGLPIGSGEVEARCKALVEARCKQSGMRWKDAGLEPLLRVRCAVRDGRYWREFGRWRGNLLVWQLRRKAKAAY